MADQNGSILDMSDSDFMSQYGSGSDLHDDSTNKDSNADSSTSTDDYDSASYDEYADYDDPNIGYDDEDTSYLEPEQIEEEYKRIIGSPIKGAGKEVTLTNTDEAIKLIQMGMGYHKTMEQIKPHKKAIAMLEQNGLLDTTKLNFAIDLMNKNPKAIQKLISDSGMDLYDLDVSEDSNDYIPPNYSVSDEELALTNAVKEIEGTPTYTRTITVLGTEWDNASRDILRKHPELVGIINDQMASGVFDTVSKEVERYKLLGKLPTGMNDLEAYKFVGDTLYANNNPNSAPRGQQNNGNANVNTPIKTPNRDTVIRQKRATSVPRGQSSNRRSRASDNVWDMDDDDFIKRFGRGLDNFG